MSYVPQASGPLDHVQFVVGLAFGWCYRRILDKLDEDGDYQRLRLFAQMALAALFVVVFLFTSPSDYAPLNMRKIFSGFFSGWVLDWLFRARHADGAREAAPQKKKSGTGKTAVPAPDAYSEAHNNLLRNIIFEVARTCVDDSKKVHHSTALSSLGALAGFGCQVGIREGIVKPGTLSEGQAFSVIKTADGDTYYYGDLLNNFLFEGKVTVWGMVTLGLKAVGCTEFPDVNATARHVVQTLGDDNFGVLTAPEAYQPTISPMDSLKALWPRLAPAMREFLVGEGAVSHKRTQTLGLVFAHAANLAIAQAKETVPPAIAGQIVFESAMMMSKIDPTLIESSQLFD